MCECVSECVRERECVYVYVFVFVCTFLLTLPVLNVFLWSYFYVKLSRSCFSGVLVVVIEYAVQHVLGGADGGAERAMR